MNKCLSNNYSTKSLTVITVFLDNFYSKSVEKLVLLFTPDTQLINKFIYTHGFRSLLDNALLGEISSILLYYLDSSALFFSLTPCISRFYFHITKE